MKTKKKRRVIKTLADLKDSDLPKAMDGPALIYDPVAHRKAVRGSKGGDSLEIQRVKFHKLLAKLGLGVTPYVTKRGWTELREHLRHEENKYIKISKYRGNLERCHWRDWELDEGMLDAWGM